MTGGLHNEAGRGIRAATLLHAKEMTMSHPDTPQDGEFTHWVKEKSEALKFELGEKFPPATSGPEAVHAETFTQRIEEVLLGHEQPDDALLEELAALENAPPMSDEELARQALEDGGGDADPATPE
jgi:hypothetical protein